MGYIYKGKITLASAVPIGVAELVGVAVPVGEVPSGEEDVDLEAFDDLCFLGRIIANGTTIAMTITVRTARARQIHLERLTGDFFMGGILGSMLSCILRV